MHQETSETIRSVAASVFFVAGFTLLALGVLSYLKPEGGCPSLQTKMLFGFLPPILAAVAGEVQPFRVLRWAFRAIAVAALLTAAGMLLFGGRLF